MTTSAATAVDASPGTRIVVARQPITNRQGAVVAFELLYRSVAPDGPAVTGEQMTASVVLGALSIGVDQLVGDKSMFCNAERSFLVGTSPVTLPADRTVVEILETVDIDDEAVDGCRRLVDAGFRLALDDFVWSERSHRLLELATIVKVDFRAQSRHQIAELVERCRPYGVMLLAEKVETDEELTWAMDRGFELFQGFAIERPAIVHGRTVGASEAALVQLATTMLSEDLDIDRMEEVLRREPGLVIQLLQMASIGSHLGLRRQVRTVREALVLLGTARIRQWVALTVLGGQTGSSPDGLAVALCRARMVELLAPSRGIPTCEFAFTAGLLSCLDVLLGVELEALGDSLDLDPDLKRAAFTRQGPVGELVAEVAAYQERLREGAEAPADLDAVAAEAFSWAIPVVSHLGR